MSGIHTVPSSDGIGVGGWWRTFKERNRQFLIRTKMFGEMGVDEDLRPTEAARADRMKAEAGAFAQRIKACEKSIRGLKLADDTFLTTCKEVLSSALPRVYELGQDGEAVPVGDEDTIGRGCSVDEIDAIANELSGGLETDVLTPMKQWLFAWSTVQARLRELDDKRIEMDSRRRQVASLRDKEVGLKRRVDNASTPQQRATLEVKLQTLWTTAQHKEGKLQTSVAAYQSMESEVMEELSGLIRDAVCLKSYLAACTEFQREAFRSISAALIGIGPQRAQTAVVHTHQAAGGAKASGASGGGGGGGGGASQEENPFGLTQSQRDAANGSDAEGGGKPLAAVPKHALYGDDIKLPVE